jgi:predicted metal-dependent HD superfamily phosphohydrolase
MSVSIDKAALANRWRALCQRMGLRGDVDAPFTRIVAAYEEPTRPYHNLRHIAECLGEFAAVHSQARDPDAIEAAIWFHDAIYDATRPDNEGKSADLAADVLRQLGADESRIGTIRELILATRHKTPPVDPDQQLLTDIDLAILGQPAAAFNAYERAIRQEYSYVPDAQFVAGRAAILKAFLARDVIYTTNYFRAKYDQAARENVKRSIARLSGNSV